MFSDSAHSFYAWLPIRQQNWMKKNHCKGFSWDAQQIMGKCFLTNFKNVMTPLSFKDKSSSRLVWCLDSWMHIICPNVIRVAMTHNLPPFFLTLTIRNYKVFKLLFFIENHSVIKKTIAHTHYLVCASTNPKIKNIKQEQRIKCGSNLDTIAAQCTFYFF